MSEFWALLTADAATRLMAALNRCSIATDGDTRTADQRRADALADLADLADTGSADINPANAAAQTNAQATANTKGHNTSSGPVKNGRRGSNPGGPSIHVTVSLTTLLGCDDQPGELTGYGPIPASMARRLADDPTGTWRRLVTDHAGGLLDASRTYQPPMRLREHVIARDRTCRFPGCRRQARNCEIDHCRAWEHGGPTAADNLHALCARHHHLKHEAPGWRVARLSGGDTEWRSPTGRSYVEPVEPYPLDPRPELYAS